MLTVVNNLHHPSFFCFQKTVVDEVAGRESITRRLVSGNTYVVVMQIVFPSVRDLVHKVIVFGVYIPRRLVPPLQLIESLSFEVRNEIFYCCLVLLRKVLELLKKQAPEAHS